MRPAARQYRQRMPARNFIRPSPISGIYAYMVPFCRCLWPGRDDAVLLLPDELGAGTLTVAPLDAAEEFRVQRSSPRRAEAESRFCPERLHFCRQVQHGCQL